MRSADASRGGAAPAVSARALGLVLRLLLLIGLLFGIYQVVRRAVASWFVHQATQAATRPMQRAAEFTAEVRRAMRWDADDPRHPAMLGRALQYSPEGAEAGEVLSLFERAVELAPHRANLWVQLASAYEWAGRQDFAQRTFEHALALFPNSPKINWQLANYSLRADRVHEAAGYLRACIRSDASLRRPAFDLAWRATGDASFVLNEILPRSTPAQLAYLDYLADTARLDAAADVWAQLRDAGFAFPPANAFRYLDALRGANRAGELDAAWSALAERHADKLPRRGPGENLIINGDFETEPVDGGLDWRVMEAPGVTARTVSSVFYSGGRSLEIDFADADNISYGQVVQFVPVEPGRRYRFRAHLRAAGITTDRGPRIQIHAPNNPAAPPVTLPEVLGNVPWTAYSADVVAGPDTRLLSVRVVRPPSEKFPRQFRGTLWLDGVSLVSIP